MAGSSFSLGLSSTTGVGSSSPALICDGPVVAAEAAAAAPDRHCSIYAFDLA
jgi:hypothetical protein